MSNPHHFLARYWLNRIHQGNCAPILGFIMAIILSMGVISDLFAQQLSSANWYPSEMLFETTGRASEAEVVVDVFGMVHVFWSYAAPDTGRQAIYYTRKESERWLEPVDILISPEDRVARMQTVAVDDSGYLHIAWSGGNAIFYSRVYAPQAASPQAWLPPKTLVSGASALEPSITIGPDNNLYLTWTQALSGLMLAQSPDNGDSWTSPEVIFAAPQNNELVRWANITSDNAGQLHIAFTHTFEPGLLDDTHFLYYLRSQDGGATWSEPYLVVDEPGFGQVSVTAFADNMVHLAWNGRANRRGRYHRWSNDGGNNWSGINEFLGPAPQNPIGTGGLTGIPAMVVDSAGGLHLASSEGLKIYYFSWQSEIWSSPVYITDGVDGQGVTGSIGSLEQPSIAISEGNQIHVAFHDGFERIWYTTGRLDIPHEPPRPLVLSENNEAASSAAGLDFDESLPQYPVATTPSLMQWQEAMPPPKSQSNSLWYAIISVILFLGVVIALRKAYK